MKITKKILALAIMAVAMVFASCSKDDDNDPVGPTQQEIETKIIGKWKIIKMDGKDVTTNTRSIDTYYSEGKGYTSVSNPKIESSMASWMNKLGMTYIINGNELAKNTDLTAYSVINTISDSKISMMFTKIVDNGKVYVDNRPAEYAKVTVDYSKDIVGLWEGVDMTGYETYGDAHHRIEYRADGTYTYYSWDEATQAWKPLEDVFDEWNVDGDWLATRWQNKGSDVMNYEWWDIDYIKDGMMKWSALREKEDGTRFTTTFTWKKVK